MTGHTRSVKPSRAAGFQPVCSAATVAIALPGRGAVDGEAEGNADADVLTDGLTGCDGVPPAHATPLNVNEVGAVLLPDHDPLKPKEPFKRPTSPQ
ncbi:hypothetical protein Cs7R123_06700 [Catellatospora sp. TT07R-123]|uniref:hypothetical protein n=1 Tax=Catellatospora sp. TT07R-123 TaxID=2733863 RepID=UPI001B04218F|nr:hypothetical protein [Catellatospora sp. TT07R-123]GHJ43328.1 hypothetical protein Cs7R123_06700 [Catellatospora sp. TT07R-123]